MNGYTSGKINHDPMPYVWPEVESRFTSGPIRSMFSHGDGIALTYAPRPEFDNHNRILAGVRVYGWKPLVVLRSMDSRWSGQFTAAEREHARRVLTKLANIYKGD